VGERIKIEYKQFANSLLRWFKQNKRNFQWREKENPYEVLIAEILLRKTDASKVTKVYDVFLKKYPDPERLATAPLKEIEDVLKPIGLYKRRAKELKCLAKILIDKYDGKVPDSKEELEKLPGVGEYIANAVLCFAYGKSVPIVDTNLIRILDRVFGVRSTKSRPRMDKELWQFAEKILPKKEAKNFNLAILDFAALVCTAKKPKCQNCPIRELCRTFRGGT